MTGLTHPNVAPNVAPPRPVASVIVPCKGRLHHLRRTLPNMLAQQCDFGYEVIVVDYSCPQETYDWCCGLNVRNLTVLKVLDDAESFNHSRCRNCGACNAVGSVLAFVDADVRLEPDWLQTATRCPFRKSFASGNRRPLREKRRFSGRTCSFTPVSGLRTNLRNGHLVLDALTSPMRTWRPPHP
jgi:glycosyltransferase involved in cell wall biosynthesis